MRFLVLLLVVLSVMASPYNPKNHQSGHELEVALFEDKKTIFVIMWQLSDADKEVQTFNSQNKTQIDNQISGFEAASFSVIDMSIADHIDKKKPEEEYITMFELIHGEDSFEKRKEEM